MLVGGSISPALAASSERGCTIPSTKRGEGAEDCARPGSCAKNAMGEIYPPAAVCVGEEDAAVDPVESHSLT